MKQTFVIETVDDLSPLELLGWSEYCCICHNLTGDSELCGICRIILDVWNIDMETLGVHNNHEI